MSKPSLAGLEGPKLKIAKAAYMREYRKEQPDKFKAIDLKKKFGITLDEYREMLKKQNDVCAICKNPEFCVDHRTGKVRSLAVDHDHTTGKARGLLCTNCNTLLGYAKDSIDNLKKAIFYLKKA